MIFRAIRSRRVRTSIAAIGCVGVVTTLVFGGGVAAHADLTSPGDPVVVDVGGPPYALAVDSSAHRVYFTDRSSGSIGRFTSGTASPVIQRIATSAGPVAVAIDETLDRGFVANLDAGTVTEFSTEDDAWVAATASTVVATIPTPSGIAIDHTTHAVYVTSSSDNAVYEFSGDSSDSTPPVNRIPVGPSPRGVAVDQSNHGVFVADSDDNTVAMFDGSDLGTLPHSTPRATFVTVGARPSAVAVDASTHRVAVTNLLDGTVSLFDPASTSPVITTVTVGRAPASIVIDDSTHIAFVGNSLDVVVSQFNTRSATPAVLSLDLGKAVGGIDLDRSTGRVFTTNRLNSTVSSGLRRDEVAATLRREALPVATVGQPYSYQFGANGNPAPAIGMTSDAPPGMHWDGVTHTLSGIPTTQVTTVLTVVAANHVGADDVESVAFTANEAAPVITASGSLPSANVGVGYRVGLLAAGSTPATCRKAGALPAGLTLSATTCVISGIATAAVTRTVDVTATNSGGSVTSTYSITVTPVPGGGTCPDLRAADANGAASDDDGSLPSPNDSTPSVRAPC